MIVEAVLGVLSGGLGSWINRGFGLFEKKQEFQHELKLLDMQMQAQRAETENELAIVQEESIASMRNASYAHDVGGGTTSRWVNNTLRLVRPVLTAILVLLVGAVWFSLPESDESIRVQIIDGILFMSSASLAWWFGSRDTQHSNKGLPWK